MKTIPVPTGGSDTDDTVLSTALAAARPFTAHLNFVHVKVGPGEAVVARVEPLARLRASSTRYRETRGGYRFVHQPRISLALNPRAYG
jgi:hypothetical protein